MSNDVETVTLTLESDDDTSDELEVPAGLVDLVAEGDQETAETVGDIVLLSFASRAHHLVHHGHGEEVDADLEAQEQAIMDLFENRFGVTFGEATGHQH